MLAARPPSSASSRRNGAFQATVWSRVIAAGRLDAPDSRKALESLCSLYWYPVYAFLRRWGHNHHDACDLTQGFFAYLLKENLLHKADPSKGRFRSFLLGSLKMFVSNQQAKEHALKRGGGVRVVSIDEQNAEGRYVHEPATDLTPDKLFDRGWALGVISEAMRRLQREYQRTDSSDLFEVLEPYLVDENVDYAGLAARLNKTPGAARMMVCRLRNRFRQLVREIIAATVAEAEQVDIELQDIQAILRES